MSQDQQSQQQDPQAQQDPKAQQDPLYNDPQNSGILSWTNQTAWNAFGWSSVIALGTYAVKRLLDK